MRILLDECVPSRLKDEFPGHVVLTTSEAGWSGSKNGELLAQASEHFDVFVTVDRNLSYQQDLARFDIAVVVLVAPGNRLADLQPLMPTVLAALSALPHGRFVLVRE